MKKMICVVAAVLMMVSSSLPVFAAEEVHFDAHTEMLLDMRMLEVMKELYGAEFVDAIGTRGLLCPECELGEYKWQERVFDGETNDAYYHYVHYEIYTVCDRARHYVGTDAIKHCSVPSHRL